MLHVHQFSFVSKVEFEKVYMYKVIQSLVVCAINNNKKTKLKLLNRQDQHIKV